MKALLTIACLMSLALLGSCGHEHDDGMTYNEIMAQAAADDWNQCFQKINYFTSKFYAQQISHQDCVDSIQKIIDDHYATYANVYNTNEQRFDEINDWVDDLNKALSNEENSQRIQNHQRQEKQRRQEYARQQQAEFQEKMRKIDQKKENYSQACDELFHDYWNGTITREEYYNGLNNLTEEYYTGLNSLNLTANLHNSFYYSF